MVRKLTYLILVLVGVFVSSAQYNLYARTLTAGAYSSRQSQAFKKLCNALEGISTAGWGPKIRYWEKIGKKDSPDAYLPPEVQSLAREFANLELGKTADLLHHTTHYRLHNSKGSNATEYVSLWRGTIKIPINVKKSSTPHDFARLALGQAKLSGAPLGFVADQVIFNGFPTKIYLGAAPSKNISVRVSSIWRKCAPLYTAIPQRIKAYNSSFLWGYYKILSSNEKFCSTNERVHLLFPHMPKETASGRSSPVVRAAAWIYILSLTQSVDMAYADVEVLYAK